MYNFISKLKKQQTAIFSILMRLENFLCFQNCTNGQHEKILRNSLIWLLDKSGCNNTICKSSWVCFWPQWRIWDIPSCAILKVFNQSHRTTIWVVVRCPWGNFCFSGYNKASFHRFLYWRQCILLRKITNREKKPTKYSNYPITINYPIDKFTHRVCLRWLFI